MSQQAAREQYPDVAPSRRGAHRPSLSVVLVSQGDRRDLERALAAVAGRCRRMEAEIIVVRSALLDDAGTLGDAYPCVTFLDAPAGTDTREMRDVGMQRAAGDIVALRMDGAVGDGMWLDAFNATVGTVDDEAPLEAEVSVMISVEESPTQQADRRRARSAFAPSVATPAPKRRTDVGLVDGGLADFGIRSRALGPEM